MKVSPSYRASRVASQRKHDLKRKFDMTPEDFERMRAAQDGKCMICLQIPTTTLHIDHDHADGRVRGLLCVNCNQAIGKLGDDPERIERAARYLRHSSA